MEITEQPKSQPVRVGASVTLRCKARGYPAPQYQWVKDGAELPDGIDEELTFDCVTMNDSGKYNCIVSNRINAEKSNTVELQVLPSPGKSGLTVVKWLCSWPVNQKRQQLFSYSPFYCLR